MRSLFANGSVHLSPLVLLAGITLATVGCGAGQKKNTTPVTAATAPRVSPETKESSTSVPAPDSSTVAVAVTSNDSGDRKAPDLLPILFDYNSTTLKPTARDTLAALARFLETNPQMSATVSGHCDERGTEEYNIALGDSRAGVVRDYLVRLGIDDSRIRTISFGELRPVDPGHDESAWTKNRRSEWELSQRR
ncbi:MAG: OmpA family protein [Pseudomonadota bacterium]